MKRRPRLDFIVGAPQTDPVIAAIVDAAPRDFVKQRWIAEGIRRMAQGDV